MFSVILKMVINYILLSHQLRIVNFYVLHRQVYDFQITICRVYRKHWAHTNFLQIPRNLLSVFPQYYVFLLMYIH